MKLSLGPEFIYHLIINSVFILILVRLCYYRVSRNRAYAASFILFGTGVFLVTAFLHSADISMGFAFGLFAVFSMLRYRTESISIKEMTYLFLVICIALLTAVGPINIIEIIIINAAICFSAFLLETNAILPLISEQTIKYEKIANIRPDKRSELLDDLVQRTGLNINSVEILSVDFLTDTALIKVYYKE